MHSANFKTFVNTGNKEPQELSVEYLPQSDLVVFSIGGQELFSLQYQDNFDTIARALESMSYSYVAEDEDKDDD